MGQPTFEDTRGQRAVAMRLAALYEQDLQDSSYGLRRGGRPHEARHALRARGLTAGIGGIVDAEGRGACESRETTV